MRAHRSTRLKTMALQSDQLLRRPAVEELTGLSRSTLYEMMPKGAFPRPVKIGARAVAWRKSQVDAWIRERH